ncbi:MAG: RnfH family protein [Gammaproteobacteria bacterium]|nr:RnfH family protein [Gammaproteobacteria bacterium]
MLSVKELKRYTVVNEQIEVEVAYATPEEQVILKVTVEKGMDAKSAIVQSKISETFPEIDPESAKVGVYGKTVKLDQVLDSGDRVEIYRELIADPKAARKKKAAAKKDDKPKAKAESEDANSD